ncbi:hypothetical protein [Promicromonospora sp. NPDC050249]|uniref:hypothetical protein n=1 Tax=Promicromonospora sp. NPDC050249 TaxID=3154743 RepID=UPI0033EF6691
MTNVYGTSWKQVEHLDGLAPLGEHLRLGRLANFYARGADQLPAVSGVHEVDVASLRFRRWSGTADAARLWLFTLPSGQSAVAFTVEFTGKPIDAVELLEDCYYEDMTVDGDAFDVLVADVARAQGMPEVHGLAPERHQLVFLGSLHESLDEDQRFDLLQRLIYRADLPTSQRDSSIVFPAELNRRSYTTVAVGPYVSALAGQQDYIENVAFVSAVECVASAVRLREVREMAYEDVRVFRDAQAGVATISSRRRTLERMSKQLGNLELELSFSVDASRDLGLLVPSLRVASFHETLFDGMGLRDTSDVVGRMLQRLERSITAELTSIESMDRRLDDGRRRLWAIAVGFLSVVALPITLVLAFFGANAAEVDQSASMFSLQYLPMYGIILVLILLGLALSFGLYAQQRLQFRKDAEQAETAMGEVRSMVLVRRRSVSARR